MNKYIFTTIIATLLIFSQQLLAQGHKIKVNIAQLKNQEVILGHHFATKLIPDDTIKLNNRGEGTFSGKEALPGGMYFIFLPSKNYFDFIVDKDQQFTLINDTTDITKNLKSEGSPENSIFIDYQKFLNQLRDNSKRLVEERKKAKGDKEKIQEIDKKLKKINNQVKEKINGIITANPDYFFSKFLKSTLEIEIPEKIKDKKERYYYYRNHYFSYFDFKDPRLLRSPIYENKLDFYLDKVILQAPDTLIPQVDMLIDGAQGNKELFRYMLVHLFNKYASSEIMGMENVYVHIAEKYYIPDAKWSDPEFIKELKRKVERKKPALIGNIAPEIKMIQFPSDSDQIVNLKDMLTTLEAKGNKYLKDENTIKNEAKELKASYPNMTDSAATEQAKINQLATIVQNEYLPNFDGYVSLHQIKSKFIIMWFWEPDCSHCQHETPLFSKAYDKENLKDKGVTVFSVYLHRNINEWDKYIKHIGKCMNFILKDDMAKWINVWEPMGYSHFRDKFDISSSPVLYLLDENKKIIAKRIGYQQAINIIDEILKNEKKQK